MLRSFESFSRQERFADGRIGRYCMEKRRSSMPNTSWCLRAFALALGVFPTLAAAQQYPVKPVRILVGYAPGGGTDIMARVVAAKLGESMKHQFVVDNRPGANGNLAGKLAAESPGDGYTI